MLKTVNPHTNENKNLQKEVLYNVGGLFNELSYIYQDKYNEEKDGLNTRDKKSFYKKLRLTDDYHYESEEEQQQTSKNLIKKNYLKKQQKMI